MRIAILGWGSLINEPRDLPIVGPWQPDGPVLWIEFSRISKTGIRAQCLTLVIDETHGTEVRTYYTSSSSADLFEAIQSLQARESCCRCDIGFYNAELEHCSENALASHPNSCERIRLWAKEKGFDAVVWTALPPRFKEVIGLPFSKENALKYLNELSGEIRRNALAYIHNAPEQTKTNLRDMVRRQLGLRGFLEAG